MPIRTSRTCATRALRWCRCPRQAKTAHPARLGRSGQAKSKRDGSPPSRLPGRMLRPPPPPPLPADLAAAGIIVPPKPPLPARRARAGPGPRAGARARDVEPEPEPEPRSPLPYRSSSRTSSKTCPRCSPTPIVRGDALVIRSITKSFGDTRAVEGIDLTVPAGTFYGLVGPNGAGKTTTLSMIAGLLRPDKGRITVARRGCGIQPPRREADDGRAARSAADLRPAHRTPAALLLRRAARAVAGGRRTAHRRPRARLRPHRRARSRRVGLLRGNGQEGHARGRHDPLAATAGAG